MVTVSQPDKELGRRERRKEETRRQIFQAAMKLFEKKGIIATTVEEITQAADVGKGTFFNYFPSKEAIFSALAERQLGIVDRAVEAARTANSVRPVLLGFCKEISSGPGRSPVMLRSLLGTVLNNKLLFALFSTVLAKGRERLAIIIARGQDLGEIRRDFTAEEIARCMQQSVFGTNFIWAISKPSELMVWQEKQFAIFWRGIATVANGPSSKQGGPKK